RVIPFGSRVNQVIDRLQNTDLAEKIDLSHRKRRLHWPAAGRASQSVSLFERIVAAGQQGSMANLGVPRLIPGDSRQIVLGVEIFKANVPNERAKGFNGIHLIALRADKA